MKEQTENNKAMTRAQILRKYNSNSAKIRELKVLNKELNRQHLLLSDKNQWYKEESETFGRGKSKETALIGRVYWKEKFADEGNGKPFYIERSQVIRKNGEWIEGL